MRATTDTTWPDDDSVGRVARSQIWLTWVFPESRPPLALEHRLLIGRDAECGAQVVGNGVSRRHAEIYRQGPIFALKDLGSTNGTFLNAKRVQHGPVVPGAVLRIGEHVGVFTESVGEPAPFREVATGLFGGHDMIEVLGPVASAAKSDLSIVVVGSTGTGKERVARAIHEFSGRKGAFHALNCAALPKDLAEAELFGYRKGAFTGADRAGAGHFRAAHRGTLFLDEVAELPLVLQAKLLRVLEERTVMPLGETDSVPVDVRVVAAVQRPLEGIVEDGLFREDLMARLSGLTVTLPPLRSRPTDIASLFRHFVDHHSGGRPPQIDAKLVECLCLYSWPTNVRELEQLTRRLLAVHGLEPTLKRSFLPSEMVGSAVSKNESGLPPAAAVPKRRDHDVRQLALALRKNGGNVSAAATALGFSRQRAYRLLDGRSAAELVAQELPEGSADSEGSV
jgi:transcriptional regulator with AAA-type ATPase domain